MSVSVRVERVRELPGDDRIAIEPHPDGTTTIYMLEEDISDEVACCLGDGLTCVKRAVYYPMLLACAAARRAAVAN